MLGLDIEQFREDMTSPDVAARIQADRQEAISLGLSGTPTFFINGRFTPGARPFEVFRRLIDEELARG